MQHIPWNGDMAEFPEPLRRYLRPGHVFDSSSSAEATVYYSDIGQGCYIRKARHGALRNEAAMTRYFHDKGLAAAVLHYGQDHDSNDWLATACLPGDDLHRVSLREGARTFGRRPGTTAAYAA